MVTWGEILEQIHFSKWQQEIIVERLRAAMEEFQPVIPLPDEKDGSK